MEFGRVITWRPSDRLDEAARFDGDEGGRLAVTLLQRVERIGQLVEPASGGRGALRGDDGRTEDAR